VVVVGGLMRGKEEGERGVDGEKEVK